MSIKDALLGQGIKRLTGERLTKLMQNERFMRAVMTAISMPGRAQTFARERIEGLARAMALATEDELQDLQRTVRKLEEDLARVKAEQRAAGANGGRNGV